MKSEKPFETVLDRQFKALVKGDGGLIVYRLGGGIAPVTVPWRGFGALGFGTCAPRAHSLSGARCAFS